jgi:hypothetical protein
MNKINKIDKINICNLEIKKSFFKDKINSLKNKNVGITEYKNKKYILKKENSITDEYLFYKKFSKKIEKDCMQDYIQIPIKYKNCKINNKDTIYYLFKPLDKDYNKSSNNKNIFGQLLLIVYYINHKLKFYHNDLFSIYKLPNKFFDFNNIMISKNKYDKKEKNKKLIVDDLSIKIDKYICTIIDFEYYSKQPTYRIKYFYSFFSNMYQYNFEYKSEIFILFIIYYMESFASSKLYVIPILYNYFENIMISEWQKKNNIKNIEKEKEGNKNLKDKKFKTKDFDRIIFKNYLYI